MALVETPTQFLVVRVLLGLFAGGTVTLVMSLANTRIPSASKGAAFGVISSATLLGTALTLRADLVLDWNTVALHAIKDNQTVPPMAARNLAILHAAIFDAANGVKQPHEQKFHCYSVKGSAKAHASEDAAISAAAHKVLVALCDIFDDRIDRAKKNIPVENPKVYKNYKDLLASDVDAVIIATPVDNAVTVPVDMSMSAISGLLLAQVPPGNGSVNVVVVSTHRCVAPDIGKGSGLTVTTTVVKQPEGIV